MQDIDFLPYQYHQKHVRRQSQPWRIIVVVAFALLLVAGALSQRHRKLQAEEELAAVEPPYAVAVKQNDRLAGLQSELQAKRIDAELFTYLRHPWPRTQLVAALLAPLPEEITLQVLQITRERPQTQGTVLRRSRSETQAEEAADAKLAPAARDLKRLRGEFDEMVTVVVISGTTRESAALHRYLGELGGHSLFVKAELDSIESVETAGVETSEFRATLLVRPGYGLPDGPTGMRRESLTQIDRRTNWDQLDN